MSEVTLAFAVRIESPLQEFLLAHLARSLRSVSEQTVIPRVVVVDYGSLPAYWERIADVAAFGGANAIVATIATEWSRSRALNVALRPCRTAYFAAMDADCLLPPTYIETLLELASPNNFVLAAVRRLYGHANTYLEALTAPARAVHPEEGHGLICAPTAWLHQVHGYDERYRVWGQEDSDLLARARFSGLAVHQLPFDLAPQHLPHPGPEQWLPAADVASAKAENRMRYQDALRSRNTVVNPNGWGMG